MKQRQDLVERFSTFILWDNNRFQTWVADPRLRRSMERCLAQESSTSEQYWVLFWHQDWLNQRELAARQESRRTPHHLHAYLQEPCYRVAETLERDYQSRLQYTIEDYFNLGFLNVDKILSTFNSKLNPNLAAYAFSRIKWQIIDEMRRLERPFGHTIWSLLLGCTETGLKKALISDGISQESIENYLIAWDYYKELYSQAKVRTKGKLQEPSSQTWEEINKAYNQEQPNSKCDVAIIKKWLNTCGQSLLNSLSLSTISSNTSFYPEAEGELQDIFVSEENTPLERVEEEENKQEDRTIFQKIYECLKAEIERLEPERQLELEMYYGKKLTQTEIAEKLDVNQSTILKRLRKSKKRLARYLIQWSATDSNFSLKANDIETMSNALKAWLEYHYQNPNINK